MGLVDEAVNLIFVCSACSADERVDSLLKLVEVIKANVTDPALNKFPHLLNQVQTGTAGWQIVQRDFRLRSQETS